MSTNPILNYENENIKTFNSIAIDDDILQMYLKDVGKTKMINHREELRLAKIIREGNPIEAEKAKKKLVNSFSVKVCGIYEYFSDFKRNGIFKLVICLEFVYFKNAITTPILELQDLFFSVFRFLHHESIISWVKVLGLS